MHLLYLADSRSASSPPDRHVKGEGLEQLGHRETCRALGRELLRVLVLPGLQYSKRAWFRVRLHLSGSHDDRPAALFAMSC